MPKRRRLWCERRSGAKSPLWRPEARSEFECPFPEHALRKRGFRSASSPALQDAGGTFRQSLGAIWDFPDRKFPGANVAVFVPRTTKLTALVLESRKCLSAGRVDLVEQK